MQHTLYRLVIALALVLGLVGPAAVPAAAGRLHPWLAQMALATPGQVVSVIVQKADRSQAAELLAARLGATVTRDLSIVNGFSADLTAAAAHQLAQSGSVRWISPDAPMRASSALAAVLTTWATSPGSPGADSYSNSAAIVDSALGPNGSFGSGGLVSGAFAGFEIDFTPGAAVEKVEVVLAGYSAVRLNNRIFLTLSSATRTGSRVGVADRTFDAFVGADKAGPIYIDITSSLRGWGWVDFEQGLQLLIEQGNLRRTDVLYYDAIGLRITSAAGQDAGDGSDLLANAGNTRLDQAMPANAFQQIIGAPRLWAEGNQGRGITVAIVDSGLVRNLDLSGQNKKSVNFNLEAHNSTDQYGHGTFMAGLVAGTGKHSRGLYIGVAPDASLLNVRVSGDDGESTEADVVAGLQWVYENRAKYKIRVVNLSLNSSMAGSYHTSPLDAAVEVLWFNGIVVVVSAGNNGSSTLYAPANDPFVITVGATDDRGTAALSDDVIASYSSYGQTEAGLAKPELLASGTDIIGLLPDNHRLTMGIAHGENREDDNYFRMSGTSVAAPIVSGIVALLLEREPTLTPDQVKFRLMATANKSWPGYNAQKGGAGYADAYAAAHTPTITSANTGQVASQLLWVGGQAVAWNSVMWNTVMWNSVMWNSVMWNSDYWGQP
jgi:serine protease AprX